MMPQNYRPGLDVVRLAALLPGGWLAPVPADAPDAPEERPRFSAAATRLEAVAESLSSLAETVNEVYDALPHRCETFRWVIDNAHDALCFNCGRRESCWKQEYTATLDGMNALRPILERNGHLETGDLPAQLGCRMMCPISVFTTIQRQSTRASSFPASSRMWVIRFIEPFLQGSQAVSSVILSPRVGIR